MELLIDEFLWEDQTDGYYIYAGFTPYALYHSKDLAENALKEARAFLKGENEMKTSDVFNQEGQLYDAEMKVVEVEISMTVK